MCFTNPPPLALFSQRSLSSPLKQLGGMHRSQPSCKKPHFCSSEILRSDLVWANFLNLNASGVFCTGCSDDAHSQSLLLSIWSDNVPVQLKTVLRRNWKSRIESVNETVPSERVLLLCFVRVFCLFFPLFFFFFNLAGLLSTCRHLPAIRWAESWRKWRLNQLCSWHFIHSLSLLAFT